MTNDKVTVSVSIAQFPTYVLITELYNRIGDHMHDPEPQYDEYLENHDDMDKLEQLQTALRKHIP